MKYSELPIEVQENIKKERTQLHKKWYVNNSNRVIFTNLEGTRYFSAYKTTNTRSICGELKMGRWHIDYGVISFSNGELIRSEKRFRKSQNGTIIPEKVETIEEVIKVAQNIGTLVI